MIAKMQLLVLKPEFIPGIVDAKFFHRWQRRNSPDTSPDICLLPKVFDPDHLTNPHLAAGNGQHLPCAAMVTLAALTSIHLFTEESPDDGLPPQRDLEINVPADGRCFFTCLFLHHSSELERVAWFKTERNASGFAKDVLRQKQEDWMKLGIFQTVSIYIVLLDFVNA